jgi:phosphomannomutase
MKNFALLMVNFVFDIDGTLTDSRQPIDKKFHDFFLDWLKDKNVYLLSGSDYVKSLEQVGEKIIQSVNGSFNTAGNVYYIKGKKIYENPWKTPQKLVDFLENILATNEYPIRAGNHLEHRIGMLNFSIIGRKCTQEERLKYFEYDNHKNDRKNICLEIMELFPSLEASVGGQISIDIYPEGKNKGQILEKLEGEVYFFGDRTEKGGNDYAIAKKLQNPPHKVFQVNNWQETYELLKNIN